MLSDEGGRSYLPRPGISMDAGLGSSRGGRVSRGPAVSEESSLLAGFGLTFPDAAPLPFCKGNLTNEEKGALQMGHFSSRKDLRH